MEMFKSTFLIYEVLSKQFHSVRSNFGIETFFF
jgi:hypothetical protein